MWKENYGKWYVMTNKIWANNKKPFVYRRKINFCDLINVSTLIVTFYATRCLRRTVIVLLTKTNRDITLIVTYNLTLCGKTGFK